MRIANSAVEHCRNGVLGGSDDTRDLKRSSVVVEVAQTCFCITEIAVVACCLIESVAVGIEDSHEFHIAYLLICPRLLLDLKFAAVVCSFHHF